MVCPNTLKKCTWRPNFSHFGSEITKISMSKLTFAVQLDVPFTVVVRILLEALLQGPLTLLTVFSCRKVCRDSSLAITPFRTDMTLFTDKSGLWRYMSVPNGQRGQLKIQTQHICSTFHEFQKKNYVVPYSVYGKDMSPCNES